MENWSQQRIINKYLRAFLNQPKHKSLVDGDVWLVQQPLSTAISGEGADNSARQNSSLQGHDDVPVERRLR